MKKPQLYKCALNDMIVKAFQVALEDEKFLEYFKNIGITILGIEGFGLKNDKKEGLVISFRDLITDEIKHGEIKATVKMQLYELFDHFVDYSTQIKDYEEYTGTKVDKSAKNKKTYNFEILAENLKGKIDDVNELAKDVFE